MNNDIESIKEELRVYANQIRDTVISNESLFENKLTYICGGTLAISLTFMKDIVKLNEANYIFLLITSWSVLSFTLFLNLLSCPLSAKLARKTERKIKKLINNERISKKKLKKEKKRISKKNANYNKIVSYLNWICVTGVTIGIFLMIIFASMNIQNKKTKMAKKTNTSKTKPKGLNKKSNIKTHKLKCEIEKCYIEKRITPKRDKRETKPILIKGMTTPDMGDD